MSHEQAIATSNLIGRIQHGPSETGANARCTACSRNIYWTNPPSAAVPLRASHRQYLKQQRRPPISGFGFTPSGVPPLRVFHPVGCSEASRSVSKRLEASRSVAFSLCSAALVQEYVPLRCSRKPRQLVNPSAPSSVAGLSNLQQMKALDDQAPDRDGWPCFGMAGDAVPRKALSRPKMLVAASDRHVTVLAPCSSRPAAHGVGPHFGSRGSSLSIGATFWTKRKKGSGLV